VNPLVTVITPTWQRHRMLLELCVPSVQAQTYRPVEHLIVSDGPDPVLAAYLRQLRAAPGLRLSYHELAEHDPAEHWGHHARQAGVELASGDLIAYLDDDDAYRPEHVELLARCFQEEPQIGWAYSRMASHGTTVTHIGADPPHAGAIGTPMIMHRASVPARWGPAHSMEDWYLVADWLGKGIPYESVLDVTVDVWPHGSWQAQ
jgi:glycosyltransferase involved in cell wall biosynthesis